MSGPAKTSTCEDDGNAWASLMQNAARPLKREMKAIEDTVQEVRMAIADAQPTLAIEDACPDKSAEHCDGVGSAHDQGTLADDRRHPHRHDDAPLRREGEVPNDASIGHDAHGEDQGGVPNDARGGHEADGGHDDRAGESEGPNHDETEGGPRKKRRASRSSTTFARRYRPTAALNGIRWDAIKEVFDDKIRHEIKQPSAREDSFFKFCNLRWKEDGNDAWTHDEFVKDAQLKAREWLKENCKLNKWKLRHLEVRAGDFSFM